MYYKEHDKPYLRRKSWHKAYNRRRDAISRGAPVLKHLHQYFKNKTVSQEEHEGLSIADRRKWRWFMMNKTWEIRFVIHYNDSYNEDDIVRMEVPQSDDYTPDLWIEEIEGNIKKYQKEGEDTIEATCKALDDTGNKWEFEDHNVGTVYVGV